MGATITVRKCSFNSSRDTTRHGRVFRTSLPRVGSSSTRYTSPRAATTRPIATPILFRQTGWALSDHEVGLHLAGAFSALQRPTQREAGSPCESQCDLAQHQVQLHQ